MEKEMEIEREGGEPFGERERARGRPELGRAEVLLLVPSQGELGGVGLAPGVAVQEGEGSLGITLGVEVEETALIRRVVV